MRPGAIARRVNVRRAGLHRCRLRRCGHVRFSHRRFPGRATRCSARGPAQTKFPRRKRKLFCRCARTKPFSIFPFASRPTSFVPVKTWMPSRRKTFSISIAGVGVEFLQNMFAALDERDLDAEAREELRELARNRAAAEDDERLRQSLQRQRVVAGDDSRLRRVAAGAAARRSSRWR